VRLQIFYGNSEGQMCLQYDRDRADMPVFPAYQDNGPDSTIPQTGDKKTPEKNHQGNEDW